VNGIHEVTGSIPVWSTIPRFCSVWLDQTVIRQIGIAFGSPYRHDPGLVHQTFIRSLNRPQVAEGRCGYAGSNKAFSVERNSLWKKQLLEPLALLERRLHPQVGGARQNASANARMPSTSSSSSCPE
jgi:hypothetical protein